MQRLDTFISSQTEWSRRKVHELIENGDVKVSSKIVRDISKMINPKEDKVLVKNKLISPQVEFFYYKFNKPKNVLSTLSDPQNRLCIGDFFSKTKLPRSIVPVGRLDRKSTGLMLFTNDGDLAHRILHPSYKLKKVYRVILDQAISKRHLLRLTTGIFLDDGPVVADKIDMEGPSQMVISISVGRNRIIRRLFAFLGYEVTSLKRIAIGPIELDKCPEGEFKDLTKSEIKSIMLVLQ